MWAFSYSDELESWKEHPIYNLEVSNLGRIRRLPSQKIVNPSLNGCGYQYIWCGKRTFGVHTLVAETWHPKRSYSHFKEVDHINRNRTDNRASNLRWVTHKLNHMNKRGKGYHITRHGTYRVERTMLGKRLNFGCFKTEAEAKARSEDITPRLWNLAVMFENVIDGIRESVRNDRKLQVK